MAGKSAGILMYRYRHGEIEVFLVHSGGPYWSGKDHGAWSIPKGELYEGEDPLQAARREFREETGFKAEGEFINLGHIRQKGGKIVLAWAVEGDLDPSLLTGNTFSMEWPPKSGRTISFPEVDRGEWYPLEPACGKILDSQRALLDRLTPLLAEAREQAREKLTRRSRP